MKTEEDVIGKACVSVLVAFAMFLAIYLLCSFYSTSFEITDWTKDTRFLCALFGGVLSICAGGLTWLGLKNINQ